MNVRRYLAVARKEWLHIRRDPRSLGLALAIPMLLVILFGYALTLDLDRIPLMIWDQDGTPSSRALTAGFTGSNYFRLVGAATDYRQIEDGLMKGKAIVALVIPVGFAGSMAAGRTTPVQVLLDGSDANTATMARGYAESVVSGWSNQVRLETMRRRGIRPPDTPVDMRGRTWYNQALTSRNFIIPGNIGIIMMVLAALLTSLTFAREWETGTMEQLISTPVTPAEMVLGKLTPYCFLGILDVLLAMGMGAFVFHVPMHGNPILLLGLSALFLVGALSIGVFLSIVTRSQILASQLSLVLTYLPAILLSGFVFALKNMPLPLQVVSRLFPIRYFMTVIKGIYLKGFGMSELWGEGLLMAAFSLVMVALCIWRFRKKLA